MPRRPLPAHNRYFDMMVRLIALFLLLANCAASRSQEVPVVKDFFVDPAGRPYLLLNDDRLVTANQLGATTNSFYDSSLGSPDYIDVTNPFQILVYYREYGTVVVLDRTLSELDRIDLFANPAIRQPGAIARSYDNGLWVFDNWNYRLLRIDERGEVDQSTNDLRLQLNGPGEPSDIYVGRNVVILNFPDVSRLAVFSNFGEFRRWVEVPAATRLSWKAPYLLATKADTAWKWMPDSPDFLVLPVLPMTLSTDRKLLLDEGGYLDVPDGEVKVRQTRVPDYN